MAHWLTNMTLDRWIALTSSVGTVIAAFIAALSIRELRRQSARQYRPNVVLTSAMFEINMREETGWWWSKPGEKGLRFKDTTDYRLTLLNVGNGTAIDLHVEWSFDVDAIIAVINDLSIKRGAGIGIIKDNFGLAFLKEGRTVSGARLPDRSGPRIDYILPVAQQKETAKVNFPSGLDVILFMYYVLLLSPGGSLDDRLKKTPQLPNTVKARISYKDTGGRAYAQESSVSIGIVYLDPEAGSMGIGVSPVQGEVQSFWQVIPRMMIEMAADGLSETLLVPTSFTKAITAALQRRQ